MTSQTTPIRIDLKKDEKLQIDWQDGKRSMYPITMLRAMCPCALCKTVRDGADPHALMPQKKSALTILPGNYAEPIKALSAQLVGNYALQIEWSDQHGSGIYSFQYLRELSDGSSG